MAANASRRAAASGRAVSGAGSETPDRVADMRRAEFRRAGEDRPEAEPDLPEKR